MNQSPRPAEEGERLVAGSIRIVDAHVHWWDPARTDWYPYLSGRQQLDMGDVSGMSRAFDGPTYFAESAKWNVDKIVHVAAAAAPFTFDETMERDELGVATGNPVAIVGSIAPAESVADVVAQIDAQMAASRFRGVRAPAFEGGVPDPDVLRALQSRNLVLDVMTHPDKLEAVASTLSRFGDLTIVIEHAGWPRTDSADERRLWQSGMASLAALGDNVTCKLSGLAMPLRSMAPDVLRPWIEYCIEIFGTDRCMFASNFPVDGLHGTLDELFETYVALTATLHDADRAKLFATTAERVYRC